jgi:hypothetical protein
MLKAGKSRNARQSTALPENSDSWLDQDEIFEMDRSNLVLELRTIRRAINESAEEMEMVAVERVFVDSVSRNLARTARKLYRVSEDLHGLHRMVERARVPKQPEQSNSKPPPRNRKEKRRRSASDGRASRGY